MVRALWHCAGVNACEARTKVRPYNQSIRSLTLSATNPFLLRIPNLSLSSLTISFVRTIGLAHPHPTTVLKYARIAPRPALVLAELSKITGGSARHSLIAAVKVLMFA